MSGILPPGGITTFRPLAPEPRAEPPRLESGEIDVVAALQSLEGGAPDHEDFGLADALMDFLMPRPRDPATLSQARIVPLLGAAAALLAQHRAASPEAARLGAAALEQELRAQRALAERRATLVPERGR